MILETLVSKSLVLLRESRAMKEKGELGDGEETWSGQGEVRGVS